jgi:hypothetical protein
MSTGSPCNHGNSPGSCLYCRADRGEIQVFSGPVFPCHSCASCASFHRKLDREKLAVVLCGGIAVWMDISKDRREGYKADADAIIKYFEEGKP